MNIWKALGVAVGTALGAGTTTIIMKNRRRIVENLQRVSEDDEEDTQQASNPTELSKNDWKEALKETKAALGDKNIPMLAAGVAFFAVLAFFPTLAALVSIFSLFADPQQLQNTIAATEAFLPREMAELINTQLKATAGKPTANLWAAILAIALALWGASGGVQNLIKATNETYDVEETRGFIKLKLLSIALVLAGIIVGIPLLFLVAVQGGWLTAVGAPGWLAGSFLVIRWLLIAVIMAVALAAFYRYGPDRRDAKWQWVSWGAGAAIAIWLIGTLLFFLYAQNFGNFSKSYGIFAGIIVLMTWFNLSSFIFLLGAQVNHRLETKTSHSTRE